jgi:GTP-binding protein HflX
MSLKPIISDKSDSTEEKELALLISAYKGSDKQETCIEHLQELELLVETYGATILGKVPCVIRKYDAATFVTEGKLEELVTKSKELKANLIIFDDEITPAQQRNLEKAFGLPVIDRTEVILEVFAARAQTKEAKAQIELAKVKYEAPRLKRLWTHLSRQAGSGGGGSGSGGSGGGGGFTKGEGEKQIELDRRILKNKIDVLKREIEDVRAMRATQRVARERSEIPVFAIIGYTNAGKSTLLNALTDAKVFVENKLFATLDTTTRTFKLANQQEILLIDTVGFIRKLPHLLVAAFKSTLEEAIQADVLIHLIDVSHPMAEEQASTTFDVLQELNAAKKPIITVLNKIDQCKDQVTIQRLRLKYPKTVQISALKKEGFEDLQEMIINELKAFRKVVKLKIPQSDYAIVSEIMRVGHVINQDYEENDVLLEVDLPDSMAGRIKKYLIDPPAEEENIDYW